MYWNTRMRKVTNILKMMQRNLKFETPGEIVGTEISGKGILRLNRPEALNALTFNMITEMKKYLWSWQHSLSMVIVKGGVKAFCAGGDIKSVVKSIDDPNADASRYFYEEYELDYLTNTLAIPYVALIHGIVMGGGVGISVHGQYRVATESTLFAMPETAIGLFPDVGGSHFLSRLPNNLGMYLALTGHRLKGSDTLHSGIATHYCDSDQLSALESELLDLENVDDRSVSSILSRYTKEAATKSDEFSLASHINTIDRIFGSETLEEIFDLLNQEGSKWALHQLSLLEKMSPLSMKVTLRQIKEGKKLPLDKCFEMEYGIVKRVLEGTDFKEGVRALLIDKDKKPKWNPSSIHEVTAEMVDKYFEPLSPNSRLVLT